MNADNIISQLTKQSAADKLRNANPDIGSMINDIAELILREDNQRAAQAAGYLMIALAQKAEIKPQTLLRQIYKA